MLVLADLRIETEEGAEEEDRARVVGVVCSLNCPLFIVWRGGGISQQIFIHFESIPIKKSIFFFKIVMIFFLNGKYKNVILAK